MNVMIRPPEHVMRLQQMGAMFPTRISFLRSVMRALAAEKSQLQRVMWDMCAEGYGRALYSITFGGHTYSLFAISQPLDPENRTDRVIATAWDAAFVLYDGVPDDAEIDRMAANAPLQEGGRYSARDLCLSRANKSVRLFGAVAKALQTGGDLPMGDILNIGYLMRTTAVYGNGKFGMADRSEFCDRPGMSGPFMAEMLTVWLIRGFTHDLVEHVGGAKMPDHVKRALGVGNSTGLGMAPFLVSHPGLLHAWMATREGAVAKVMAAPIDQNRAETLVTLARRAMQHLLEWNVPDQEHQDRIVALRRYWAQMSRRLDAATLCAPDALPSLLKQARAHSADAEELTIAWALEAFPDIADAAADQLAAVPDHAADTNLDCAGLHQMIEDHCDFALQPDYSCDEDCAQFWYVSQSKLEPRIGQRHSEPGADQESPLDIARRICELHEDLTGATGPLWMFLAQHPQHRMAADRVQALAAAPYTEIHDNLIADTTHPINMLRCKLSFFGATKFDPKSRLWTRIALAQGAPLHSDIASGAMADQTWLGSFAP